MVARCIGREGKFLGDRVIAPADVFWKWVEGQVEKPWVLAVMGGVRQIFSVAALVAALSPEMTGCDRQEKNLK